MQIAMQTRLIISVLLFVALLPNRTGAGQDRSSNSKDDGCAPLVRKHHSFRHFVWSGIFPGEGGFIPDPHCLSSEQMTFPGSALKLIDSSNATYQVFDVNPFFNDDSSEIVFLIRSGGGLFEYSLDFPKKGRVHAVIATPMHPSVRVFPYRGKLALLASFSGPAKGIYLMDLPLKSGVQLHMISSHSSEFEEIAQDFKVVGLDPSVKEQFCKTTNDFAAFYEKYVGSCGWTAEVYAVNSMVHDYNGFWMKE